MSEATVQEAIIAALRTIGCWVGVNTAGHRSRGHVRAAMGAGATDLIVIDDGRVTFAETKRDAKQKLRPSQVETHAAMQRAGAYVVVWWSPQMAVTDVMQRR